MPASRKLLHIIDGVDKYRPYDEEETEFLIEMDKWIRATGRKFPAFTEIRAIALRLYERRRDLGSQG